MNLFTTFIMPAVTTTVADIFGYAQPWFDEIWPWAKWVLGITVAFFFIGLVYKFFHRD